MTAFSCEVHGHNYTTVLYEPNNQSEVMVCTKCGHSITITTTSNPKGQENPS